eukprot:CAMPEP_0176467458 /NCGR_PEP_ID=MMETSP0127-20121128/38473_1 /TAXON_ID=938130 /ORGANISM="Platyophrya macrostoma, Strain WH" /LENGTH=302 /DNA_ID=CAMNT_0017860767 /DNA_START=174 /DNA_END=1082 /DNA_ORIENTATION=-
MCWTSDGEKFIIKDPTLAEKEILPKLFNHNKYSSFTRQLSFYRFKRISDRAGNRIYCHPNFLRGNKDLLEKIERVEHKRSSSRAEKNETMISPKKDSNFDQLELLKQISSLSKQLEEARETIKELELENDKLKLQLKAFTYKKEIRLMDAFETNQLQMSRYLDRSRFTSGQQTFLESPEDRKNQQTYFNYKTMENKEKGTLFTLKPVLKISDHRLKEQFEFKEQNLNHLTLVNQRPRFLMNSSSIKEHYENDALPISNQLKNSDPFSRISNSELYLESSNTFEQELDIGDYYDTCGQYLSSA